MKKTGCSIFLFFTLFTLSFTQVFAAGPTIVSGVLTMDTVWRPVDNPYIIKDTLTIPDGIILTIDPGCDIRFEPKDSYSTTARGTTGTDLVVMGSLRAHGTVDYPISFSSTMEDRKWGSIYFGSPTPSMVSYAYVLNGKIICNGGSPEISHCCIYGGGGIEVGHAADPSIHDNQIDKNTTGLLLWFKDSSATIVGNRITRNRYGIYVKEFAAVGLTHNAIIGNMDYDMCNVSPNHAIQAGGNWWGTSAPLEVEQRIYDGRKKDGLGWVVYSPLLEDEVLVALLAPPPFLQKGAIPSLPSQGGYPYAAPAVVQQPDLGKPKSTAPALEGTGNTQNSHPVVTAPAKPTPTPEPDLSPWKSRW